MGSNPTLSSVICFYGCNQEGVKYFTSTKRWCCSNSVNRCPAKREKDSLAKQGKIPPWKNGVHPRGMKGKHSWNSGKSLTIEHRKKLSKALKGNPRIKGFASTPEKETLRKQRISDAAKNGKMGGYRHGSGRSNSSWYESPIAGRVYLDSSYEVAFAKFLDRESIPWERNQDRFSYHHDGKERKYIPDFFLPLADCFIEIKGFETELDRTKWRSLREQHQKTLLVFFEQELKTMGVLLHAYEEDR